MNSNPKTVFCTEFEADSLMTTFQDRIEQSSKSVGRDGTTVDAFKARLDEEIRIVLNKVYQGTYRFTGYKERLVSKGADKAPRQLSVATVRDRLVLRALCNVLMDVFDDRLLPAPHSFIREVRDLLRGIAPGYSFVQIDITDFYPSVRHDLLMQRLRSRTRYAPLLQLVQSAIETPTGKSSSASREIRGVPQGLSISNILSSIYMEKIDERMTKYGFYLRYVDDILMICSDDRAKRTFEASSRLLCKHGLKAHPLGDGSKSKIVSVSEGVDYLGYRVSKDLISVRNSSYHKMFKNIIGVFTQYKYKKNLRRFVRRLNLKITGCFFDEKKYGWMFFFSQTEDLNQLSRLDLFVSQQLSKAGLASSVSTKRFVKAYHEIRYNNISTSYIPRFDTYTFEQKALFISDLEGVPLEDVLQRDVDTIDKEFQKHVGREVSELERDLLEAFS